MLGGYKTVMHMAPALRPCAPYIFVMVTEAEPTFCAAEASVASTLIVWSPFERLLTSTLPVHEVVPRHSLTIVLSTNIFILFTPSISDAVDSIHCRGHIKLLLTFLPSTGLVMMTVGPIPDGGGGGGGGGGWVMEDTV